MRGLPYIPALKVESHNSVFRGTRTSTTDDGYAPNGPRADADDSVGVPSPKLGSLLGVTEALLGSWMGPCPSSGHTLGGSSAVTYLRGGQLSYWKAGVTSGWWTEIMKGLHQAGQESHRDRSTGLLWSPQRSRSRLWRQPVTGPPILQQMGGPGQSPIPISRGDPVSERAVRAGCRDGGVSAGRSSSRGKGLWPHGSLRVPSGGQELCRLCQQRLGEICLDRKWTWGVSEASRGRPAFRAPGETDGDRVCPGSRPGWDLTLENRWPSEESS